MLRANIEITEKGITVLKYIKGISGGGSPIVTPFISEAFLFSSIEEFNVLFRKYKTYLYNNMLQSVELKILRAKFNDHSFTWYSDNINYKICLIIKQELQK